MTGKIGAIFELGVGLGYINAGWSLGIIYDMYKAQGLLVTFALISFICNVLNFIVFLIGNHYGDRYDLLENHVNKCERHPLFNSDTEDY